jgi:hypothetical protein
MTKQDVLDALRDTTADQELQWMIDLGAALTVSARGSYPTDGQSGNIACLVGFNELQHQVYGRIRQIRRGEEWTLESFLDGLLQKAQHSRISGEVGWALKTAISTIK